MNLSSWAVYIVSLRSYQEIRERPISKIVDQLPISRLDILGVNGRSLPASEYFLQAFGDGYLLSPAEVGCKLSHLRILGSIVESNIHGAIILEDDIVPCSDFNVFEVIQCVESLASRPFILFLGGLDGTSSHHRIHGKPIGNIGSKIIYRLDPLSRYWLLRTCCYALNASAASLLLIEHQRKNLRIDDWNQILATNRIELYYCNLISHPVDLMHSNIQGERDFLQSQIKSAPSISNSILPYIKRKMYACVVYLKFCLTGQEKVN